MALLRLTDAGLYCEAGDFFIDPWRPVSRAVITHAHGDHLVWGCRRYLCAASAEHLVRERIGPAADLATIQYGERRNVGSVALSLHPAGHILGSAQVRLEHRGEVWVVSGDYKTGTDPTSAPFEPIRCDTFVTESTFGLPIYRWPPELAVLTTINEWWRANQRAGRATLLLGYALGKAQRLLAGLDPSIGPIYTHGAVERMNEAYRATGVDLPPTRLAVSAPSRTDFSNALILAPPAADATGWARRFGDFSSGFASGWMQVRGERRRRGLDRGFVLSDHADWPGLLASIHATGAASVWVTHGFSGALSRYLTELGLNAVPVATRFEGERDEPVESNPPGGSG